MDYLRGFYNGRPVPVFLWRRRRSPGRPFYNDDFTALNFEVRRGGLGAGAGRNRAASGRRAAADVLRGLAAGRRRLPGFARDNDLRLRRARHRGAAEHLDRQSRHRVLPLTTRRTTSPCCAVGRRRFTVFPPEQIDNLYPGPAGAHARRAGGQRGRFRDARFRALSALPRGAGRRRRPRCWNRAMRSSSPACGGTTCSSWTPFNVLVNYWWSSAPAHIPHRRCMRCITRCGPCATGPSARSRPGRRYSITTCSGPARRAGEHLPEAARDVLGPIDETLARRIRAMLIGTLNR